jgi:lipopolysaccharide transport system ATP-binding protein
MVCGTFVRLAFAVAAHLEPEILLVDEVLAVGDAAFQKKCLGKMQDVSAREGRTVLFVSHNMNAVEQLCGSCVLVEGGRLAEEGSDVRSVIRRYLYSGGAAPGSPEWSDEGGRYANPYFTPRRFALTDGRGDTLAMPVRTDGEAYVLIEGDVERPDDSLTIGYAVYNEGGALIYWTYQTDSGESGRPQLRRGRNVIASPLPGRLLNEGVYRLEMIGGLHFRSWLFEPGRAVPEIYLDIKGGLSDSPYWMARRPGAVAPVIRWKEWPVR